MEVSVRKLDLVGTLRKVKIENSEYFFKIFRKYNKKIQTFVQMLILLLE